jgi:MFS family permease
MSETVLSVPIGLPAAKSELARNWKALLAISVGIGLGIAPVPTFTTGVFAIALQKQFGWSRGDILGVVLFQTLAFGLIGPLLGRLADRIGPRPVVIASTIGIGLSTAAFALITAQIWTFYLAYAVMIVLSLGTMPPIYARMLSILFDRQRGQALGLALCTTGISGIVLPIYVQKLIGAFGWREAYVGLGLLPLLIALPCALLLLPRKTQPAPADVDVVSGESVRIIRGLSIKQALSSYRYWLMALVGFAAGAGLSGLVINTVPLLVDRGFSPATAAQMFGVYGVFVIIGRLSSGWLLDRLWAPAVGCGFLLLPAAGVLLLASGGAGQAHLALVAIAMIALASGGEFDLVAYLCSRYFGTRNFSALYSGQYAIFAMGAGIAPGLMGAVHDRAGSYQPALYAIAALFAGGAVALLALGRYAFHAEDAIG